MAGEPVALKHEGMNGPFLLLRASFTFALTGLGLMIRFLGQKRGKQLFWGGMIASTILAIILQLTT